MNYHANTQKVISFNEQDRRGKRNDAEKESDQAGIDANAKKIEPRTQATLKNDNYVQICDSARANT
jgi:hypothetical protein